MGHTKIVMETRTVDEFGLKVRESEDSDGGKFDAPGSRLKHIYTGLVETLFKMSMGKDVSVKIMDMRVVEHPTPLFLLGA